MVVRGRDGKKKKRKKKRPDNYESHILKQVIDVTRVAVRTLSSHLPFPSPVPVQLTVRVPIRASREISLIFPFDSLLFSTSLSSLPNSILIYFSPHSTHLRSYYFLFLV